jgi:hypothetical protein
VLFLVEPGIPLDLDFSFKLLIGPLPLTSVDEVCLDYTLDDTIDDSTDDLVLRPLALAI